MSKKQNRPRYEEWPKKRVRVTELFLDPENIRLQTDIKTSPAAVINDLFVNENAMQILESIANNDVFPDEMPVVVEENKKYIVIDGNRRVAALKVLANPAIVPSMERDIRQVAQRAVSVPKEIYVVIAPNREAVQHLLASKHTQNTRRPWRPLRQAYFYKAEIARGKTVPDLKKEYPGVDVERFLRLLNMHHIAKSFEFSNPRTAKKVHNERSFPATTLERLYQDKRVRDFLGFEFTGDGEVRIAIAKEEFEKGFKKIIQDIADKVVDSRFLNKEENRIQYLRDFPSSSVPNKNTKGKGLTSKSFKEATPPKKNYRTRVAPKDITFTLSAPGLKRMLIELQSINYRRFPNAAHDLLRSFLECSLKVYLKHAKVPVQPRKNQKYVYLDDVLEAFRKAMDTAGNRELAQVSQRIKSNATMAAYTAGFLNATNHNPSMFAASDDVELAWDAMEPLLRFVLDPQ